MMNSKPQGVPDNTADGVSVKRSLSRRYLRDQPVYRLLLAAFVIVALFPVVVVSVRTYTIAWDVAWGEVTEKHRLLALNLSTPISNFHKDHVDIVNRIAQQLTHMDAEAARDPDEYLREAFAHTRGFRSLALVQDDGWARSVAHRTVPALGKTDYAALQAYSSARNSGRTVTSQLVPSPIDGGPAIIVASPVVVEGGTPRGVVVAELELDVIENLRAGIKFGNRGHSVVVDANGRVVAHPNADWRQQMRDLSRLPVVGRMMNAETGVTEFYSPFLNKHMVAGYTSVPGAGWGIMVPQPKEEVEAHVNALLYTYFLWAGLGVLLAVWFAILIARWVTHPMKGFAVAANSLVERDFDGELPDIPQAAPKEVKQLGTSFRELVSGLQSSRNQYRELNQSLERRVQESTRDLKAANRRLEVLARVDDLTGVSNRRHFKEKLSALIEDAKTNNIAHALLYIDFDRLKLINDNHGHAAGDQILQDFSALLRSNVKHKSDTVSRIGGDEFAVLLNDCSVEEARHVAEKLRVDVSAKLFHWEAELIRLTVSIGLVSINANSDMSSVMAAADRCCYTAKTCGRNQIQIHEPGETEGKISDESRWMTRLLNAFEHGDFSLYCQPISGVRGGCPKTHYEILLRFSGEQEQLILPQVFIPTAERFNLMPRIDEWVVKAVFDWFATNYGRLAPESLIFINLSSQSLNQVAFCSFLERELRTRGLPPQRFCFEMTETEILARLSPASNFIKDLTNMGCKFALDDFGTGMSSFTHLKELPVDVLKIDGMFVSSLGTQAVNVAIVRAVQDIANALDLVTVAEWVENANIMRRVVDLGVDYVQGFAIQPPCPLTAIFEQQPAPLILPGLGNIRRISGGAI